MTRWPGVALAIGGLAGAALVYVGLGLGGQGATDASPDTVPAVSAPNAPGTEAPHPGDTRTRGQDGQGSSPQPRRGTPDEIAGPVLGESEPTRISIRRIGVASSVTRLGLDDAGAMEVPANPAVAGWYTGGPSPGALGPAVIAGHVTWNGSPSVFYRLRQLRSGDSIAVQRADGTVATFAVGRVARFPKAEFPTDAVFGPADRAELRLVTCGGLYDEASHRYLDNVVVFARLVSGGVRKLS